MALSVWTQPAPPWFHLLVAGSSDACNWVRGIERGARITLAARTIRGRKASTKTAFFDEVAAACQFPYYFGENWDAFYDCLADLEWLRADGILLCLADAEHVLEDAKSEFATMVEVLGAAVREWNEPALPKRPRPFHVVLQVQPGHEAAVTAAWAACKVDLARVPTKGSR